MYSTQLRKLSLYPEFKTNEGIDRVINYLTSIQKGFEPVYARSFNTRQINRYNEKLSKDFSTLNNELFYTPRINNDKNDKFFT